MTRPRQLELKGVDLKAIFAPLLRLARPDRPVWTETKARLIQLYLYYFVLVTRHGTYIDGFAGPQQPDAPDMWAAKLVLESEPRWFRHFYLYDSDAKQVDRLKELTPRLVDPGLPRSKQREVVVTREDFNTAAPHLLASGKIGPREATFCLLDQRMFDCEWATVAALARHRASPYLKIEIFYFLASGWFRRSVAALKDSERLARWWGRADFESVRDMSPDDLRDVFVERFQNELGYSWVVPWPILDKKSRRTMYYMIHCTDHPAAPMLMDRAYRRVDGLASTASEREQLELLWGESRATTDGD